MSSSEIVARAVVMGLVALSSACSRELPVESIAIATREPPRAILAGPGPSLPEAPPGSRSSTSQATHGGPGVAVVELFTSEGCSSCPPADRVLASLTARAKAESLPVYTLSFHVDYWNYLGWRDRFSSSSYSERQQGYSGISTNGGTYTPQVVVNGEAECVGSDSSRIDDLIDRALKRAPRTQIELDAKRGAQGIEIDYRVSGATAGRVLNLALLEPRAESQVEHGENAGERLAHVNVVRAFASRALHDGNTGHCSLPTGPDFQGRRVTIVAYAEASSQRDISGASGLELP